MHVVGDIAVHHCQGTILGDRVLTVPPGALDTLSRIDYIQSQCIEHWPTPVVSPPAARNVSVPARLRASVV